MMRWYNWLARGRKLIEKSDWTKKGIGGNHVLILSDGTALLAELYNKEEPRKGAVVKLDSQGNILWEKQVGSMGFDGLAVTPDSSFIAVGAADREKNGHLMLLSEDGSTLWDHQIASMIETVAVSKNGYVAAGSRDAYIYLYDKNGQLIFSYFAMNAYSSQDTAISPDESFFLFGSEYRYLNCYTLEGRFLWQKEVGTLSNIRISADGEYIAVGTYSELFLIDRDGNELWSKKVSCGYIDEVAISGHGKYIAIDALKDFYTNHKYYMEVYSREGELLWRYQDIQPFIAIAMSDDGRYIAAGSKNIFVIFDSFQAIEEYSLSECAQQDRSSFFAI